jgi:hypothetical protein
MGKSATGPCSSLRGISANSSHRGISFAAGWLWQSFANFEKVKAGVRENGSLWCNFDAFPDAVGSGKHSNISTYEVDAKTHQKSEAECRGHTFAI